MNESISKLEENLEKEYHTNQSNHIKTRFSGLPLHELQIMGDKHVEREKGVRAISSLEPQKE